MRFRHSLLLLAILMLAGGCSSNMVARKASSAQFRQNPRIAVLPFENLSEKEQVAAKVTDYFNALLAGERGFQVVEYGNIFEVLRKHRIRSASLMTDAQIDSLAQELQIDYFLTGSVLEFDEFDNQYLGKVPQVSFNARLVDCQSKNTVWAGVSHGSGDKGELVFGIGAVRSADELARKMVEKAVNEVSSLF